MNLMNDLEAKEFAEKHKMAAVFADGVCKIINPETGITLGSGDTWEQAIQDSKKEASKQTYPPTNS